MPQLRCLTDASTRIILMPFSVLGSKDASAESYRGLKMAGEPCVWCGGALGPQPFAGKGASSAALRAQALHKSQRSKVCPLRLPRGRSRTGVRPKGRNSITRGHTALTESFPLRPSKPARPGPWLAGWPVRALMQFLAGGCFCDGCGPLQGRHENCSQLVSRP